jgi:alkylation response protein AidB-like acyl-CoA dehydrogenase
VEFGLTKEQKMLRKSFTDFLSAKCTADKRKEWMSNAEGFSRDLFREIAQLGWTGLAYDETYGGMDGTFFELFLLCEEFGRWLPPGPFFASAVLSGLLIDMAGSEEQKQALLPALIRGEQILTVANLDEKAGRAETPVAVPADSGREGSCSLSGACILVPYGHAADGILVWAGPGGAERGGSTLFLLNLKAEGITVSVQQSLSLEKTAAVRLDRVEAAAENILGAAGQADAYRERLLPKAVVLTCAEMIGGMRQLLDMTVAYAKSRHQFGRPLGSLQIIQHYCADMAADLETARLLAYQAAVLLDQGGPCAKEVAMAKAWCSDVYNRSCLAAHQIFGAWGFTDDCDVHLYTRHAKASELTFGDAWRHRSRVADALGI